jgi:hypothetical protein
MAVDRARIAAALAREEQRRRLMESVPSTERVAPAPQSRNLRRELENLSIGVGEGITNQLEGLKGIVTDPIGSAKAGYEAVKGIVRDPSVLADALRYTAQKAGSGPLGAGEVMGEFLTPSVKGVGKRDIFIGKKAETWRPSAAKQAEEMEAAGIDPETIWRETGTMRGPDGELRQEISDLDARLEFSAIPEPKNAFKWADEWLNERGFIWKPGIDVFSPSIPEDARKAAIEYGKSMAGKTVEAVPLQRVLSHPELQQSYPDLYSRLNVAREPSAVTRGRYQDNLVTTGGGGVIGSKEIDPELSTLLHELQHAIQEHEGFSRGGNPEIARSILDVNAQQQMRPFSQALYERNEAARVSGQASQAQYAQKLKELQTRENIRPRALTNMSDWYKYGDKVSQELSDRGLGWQMPRDKGVKRDRWIQEAVKTMQRMIEEDRPEMRGAERALTPSQAKNVLAKTDRVFRKTQEAALAASKVKEKIQKLEEKSDFDLYQRLGGEAESRAVQARMKMPLREQRSTFPKYDVPLDEILIRR